MNLGENIYHYRSEKNMSQGDLADVLGVSRQSVSKWENNNAVPDLDKLVKMSEVFGVSLDELVNGKLSEPAQPQKSAPKIDVASPITHVSIRKIIGILLLICAILCFFVPTFLGSILVGFLFGAPLMVIGSILAFSERDWLFRICWLLYGLFVPMLSLFGYNFIRFDISSRFTIAFLLSLVPLILWSVNKARKGMLHSNTKKVIIVSILLFLLSVLIFNFLFAAPRFQLLNIFHKKSISLL